MTTTFNRTAANDEVTCWIGVETAHDGADEVSRNDIRRKLEVYVTTARSMRTTPFSFRMKGSGHPGDTLVCGASVTAIEPDSARVALEFGVDSARGRGTKGKATVWLPA